MSGAAKDVRKVLRACRRAGLTVDESRNHPRVIDPATGRFVTVSGSPSCPHAAKNALAEIRKYLGKEIAL